MITVKIRNCGRITIPSNLRRKYGLRTGSILQLLDSGDGSFFLAPFQSTVVKNADKAALKVNEAGVSLEELLETLDEERARYNKEHYSN